MLLKSSIQGPQSDSVHHEVVSKRDFFCRLFLLIELGVHEAVCLKHGCYVCAGKFAAEQYGAKVVDPKPYFVGSLRKLLQKYPHDFSTIPAIGYSPQEVTCTTDSLVL